MPFLSRSIAICLLPWHNTFHWHLCLILSNVLIFDKAGRFVRQMCFHFQASESPNPPDFMALFMPFARHTSTVTILKQTADRLSCAINLEGVIPLCGKIIHLLEIYNIFRRHNNMIYVINFNITYIITLLHVSTLMSHLQA